MLVQKEIKAVYLWTTKVRPHMPKESIIYKMNADSSWNLYVPTAWCWTNGSRWVAYSWKVSVDDGAETTYTWTSANGGKITLSWYTAWSNHTITIKPTTENYLWARAYCWYITSSLRANLTEIVYDGSYMGYAVSATDTGNFFRSDIYDWCTSITQWVKENLPDTVTTIWTYYRQMEYYWCTSLLKAEEECLPDSVTSVWDYFRDRQYYNCTSLNEIKWWKDFTSTTTGYRDSQFNGCTTNKTVKVLNDVRYVASSSQYTLRNDYVTSVSVPSAMLSSFKSSTYLPRVNISDSKFVWY